MRRTISRRLVSWNANISRPHTSWSPPYIVPESYILSNLLTAGYPCPDKMNPADHMLDCVTIGTHDDKAEREILKLAVPLCLDYGCGMDDFATRSVQPWLRQFLVLTHRNLKEKFRRWDIIAMNVLISTIIAVFISCGPWSNIGRYQESIVKRNGIIFFCTIHQGLVPSLQGTYAFPMERALMLRERAAGAYYVSAYFLAKTAIDSIFQLMAPFIFTAFVYPIIGLNPQGNKPFVFLGIQLLLCNAAVSLSNMCSCVFVSIDLATLVLACSMEITRLYSSFYISPKLLDTHAKWKVSGSAAVVNRGRTANSRTIRATWLYCYYYYYYYLPFIHSFIIPNLF